MCLCIKVLNSNSLYKVLTKFSDNLPTSLAAFLYKDFRYSLNNDTNLQKLDCINGNCKNNYKITEIVNSILCDSNQLAFYYVFETAVTNYFSKIGEEKSYTQTTQVNKKEPLSHVISQLQSQALAFLKHRFFVINDKIYSPRFLENCEHHVLWLDYSQNIALIEKMQVQSAHFSGKQHLLHNAIIKKSNDANVTSVYHLPDDTNHDSVMMFEIIENNINDHPKVIENKISILQSDNCPGQYKSKFTFYIMTELARKCSITVAWFYGEPGHGKGLVDAMSSFG